MQILYPADMVNVGTSLQIGDTPLLPIPEMWTPVLTKREDANPSGSHYDRAYDATVAALILEGLVDPSTELRDISSGSAGRSLAYIGKRYGLPVTVTVPSELPARRVQPIEEYGARIAVSYGDYIRGSSEQQREEILDLIEDRRWRLLRSDDPGIRSLTFENAKGERVCYLNHSENDLTTNAFGQIAEELIAQCPQEPAAIALAIGNWTTIAGIVPIIRSAWPGIRVIGYQSKDTETYENFGTGHAGSSGTDVPMRFKDPSLVDEIVLVSNHERDCMETLVNAGRPREGRVGRSSLMGLFVASQIETFKPILTITYDRAEMY